MRQIELKSLHAKLKHIGITTLFMLCFFGCSGDQQIQEQLDNTPKQEGVDQQVGDEGDLAENNENTYEDYPNNDAEDVKTDEFTTNNGGDYGAGYEDPYSQQAGLQNDGMQYSAGESVGASNNFQSGEVVIREMPIALNQAFDRDITPAYSELWWVGQDYDEQNNQIYIEILTRGYPKYKIFQEVNRSQQPELVVRFYQSLVRPKIRRDIDASEFKSPVSFIRLRQDETSGHSDVVLTLRDPVKPKLVAKNGNLLLKFAIPDHYFGNQTLGADPIAKAEVRPNSDIMPELEIGSDLPAGLQLARVYIPDPAKEIFENVSTEDAKAVTIEAEYAENTTEELPNDFNFASEEQQTQPVDYSQNQYSNSQGQQDYEFGTGNNAYNYQYQQEANQQNGGSEGVNSEYDDQYNQYQEQDFNEEDLNDFDDGDGESEEDVNKFDVRNQSKWKWSLFSLAAVAQQQADDVGQEYAGNEIADEQSDIGQSVYGTSQYQALSPEADAVDETGMLSTEPAVQEMEVANAVNDILTEKEATADYGVEPVSSGNSYDSVDLTGQEQVGSDYEKAEAGSLGGRSVTLDFRGAPLSEVIRVLSDESQINFILPPSLSTKKVYLTLKDVPFNDALQVVLQSNQLGIVKISEAIFRIETLKALGDEEKAKVERMKAANLTAPTKVLVYPLSYADADRASLLLSNMVKSISGDERVGVEIDKRTNSLIVNARERELALIKSLIERIDVETPQVKLESRIVEVVKISGYNFGISWNKGLNLDQGRGLGFGNLVFPNNMVSNYAVDAGGYNTGNSGRAGFRFGSINNVAGLDIALSMQEDQGTTEVLQHSNVVVEDNEQALITAGSTDVLRVAQTGVVAQGQQTGPATRDVEYNLNVKVTPHVTADGGVRMKLDISSKSPAPTEAETASAAFTERAIKTTTLRKSGETVVIGGVYAQQKISEVRGVPFFSSIPIIGALFRNKKEGDRKRELMVMITPTILNIGAAKASSSAMGGSDYGTVAPSTPEGGGQNYEYSQQNFEIQNNANAYGEDDYQDVALNQQGVSASGYEDNSQGQAQQAGPENQRVGGFSQGQQAEQYQQQYQQNGGNAATEEQTSENQENQYDSQSQIY